ncbi:hypothetical protein [Metabacillus malikii]|uniref:4-hydroxybenzoate polyprenyltransferase n=1 Tax=Metabacillus malikii TaxID=1504265 RepID=A0ABT9ZMZ9_9BACI|nr:hypothetical protein [Metabacillus malikii]MDQ0233650.1 4-hydroxybenzoate polyprenyltransferase [Metabacillus malikii]
MENNKTGLYISMLFGMLGSVLVGLMALRYLASNDTEGYIFSFLGFILIINYINYLESKANISKKVTWIRSIISIVLFIVIGYFLYF